jgi:hypothetical protein
MCDPPYVMYVRTYLLLDYINFLPWGWVLKQVMRELTTEKKVEICVCDGYSQ